MHSKLGDFNSAYSDETCPNFAFTTEWKDVEVDYKPVMDNNFLLLQCGDFVGDIYIKSIKFEGYQGKTIPLTQEERHDILVEAMDKWIKGMMEACDGKVKAWDLVNEAIAGDGNDGEGNYELQHSKGYKGGTWDVGGQDFFWQDHLGDLDYVRQACRLARKYGPEDVKLFINDYNLESDWDDNKKLKSLINWIKKWEADGVTKIDGIGTQMHISYYLDPKTQESKQKAVENAFKLMAESGKLVRISELDMGLVDADGNDVATALVTEEQHKAMAAYYTWIIKTYLSVVPAAQQWGITQWCATDSPADSGWRANSPVGLWDKDYYRKHTYAGFADGLSGK
jgi:GH35 family endo-1,4-beta-xylanase